MASHEKVPYINHKDPERNELFTVQEVADYLKTTRQQVGKMLQGDQLIAVKVGRAYRIPLSSLDAFVDEGSIFAF